MSGTADKLMVFDGGQSDVGYLRRQGTDGVMSAYDTWDFWADNNGCNLQPLVQDLPDKEDDDTTVTAVVYEGCRGGSVIGFRINNGGHSWPGGKNYKGGLIGRLIGNTTQEIDASRILALIASSNGSADVIRAR